MTVIKDPKKEQQRSVDSANAYIDSTAKAIFQQIDITKMIAKREDDTLSDTSTPRYKSITGIEPGMSATINQMKALNGDTSQTADGVSLKQSNILNKGIAEAKAIVARGVAEVNTLTHAAEAKLFSRGVDESPRSLAMLANPKLLDEIRANYLDFADNEISANAVNTFRVYGLLGDNNQSNSIAKSLDFRHSRSTVEAIEHLAEQKKALQHMENSLTKAHQLLTRDPARIVGIRAKAFE